MERLTIRNGMPKRLDPVQIDEIYRKLRFYEDLREQGKLVIVEKGSAIWNFLNCCCFDGDEHDEQTK